MPYMTYSGLYVPSGATEPHLPTIINQVGTSILGDTIPSFDSDSARNTAFGTLSAEQKRGAVNFVAGRGWLGNDGAGDQFFMMGRVKADRHDGTVEANGYARIPASKCFFEGAPPGMISANSVMGPQYIAAWVLNDGGGSLFRIRNTANDTDLTTGAAFALTFQAFKL